MSTIRAAVVGTGFIGVVHVEALRRLGVEVVGIVGSSRERAAEKAAAADLPPPYESFEAMLADPSVDVVHVTTPNHLHHPQVAAVLAAGKHVVCEKPLGTTPAESADLAGAGARERARPRRQLQPALLPADPRDPRAGARRRARRRLERPRPLPAGLAALPDRLELAARAGGRRRAARHRRHRLALARPGRLRDGRAGRGGHGRPRDVPAGPPPPARPGRDVRGRRRRRRPGRPGDGDRGRGARAPAVRERRARGAVRVPDQRRTQEPRPARGRRLLLGAVVVLGAPGGALARAPGRAERDALPRPVAACTRTPAPSRSSRAGHAEGFPDTFRELYRAVYRAVAAGRPGTSDDYPTFEDGHEENVVCDAIARSARERRWVRIDRAGA